MAEAQRAFSGVGFYYEPEVSEVSSNGQCSCSFSDMVPDKEHDDQIGHCCDLIDQGKHSLARLELQKIAEEMQPKPTRV